MKDLAHKIIAQFINTVWNDGFHEYDAKLNRKEALEKFLDLYEDYLIGKDESRERIFDYDNKGGLIDKGFNQKIDERNRLRQEQRKRKLHYIEKEEK